MKEEHIIILTVGIQGSGKSTFAKQWALEDPEHRARFNNDDVRNMLGKYWVPKRESVVADVRKQVLKSLMEKGYDIVVDNMNLNPKEKEFFNNIIDNWNKNESPFHYTLELKYFFTPLKECIRRDALRANPIGEKVIRETYERYKSIIKQEKIRQILPTLHNDAKLPKAVICDLDGTVCLNTSGRPFYGKGAAEGMINDAPFNELLTLIRHYCEEEDAQLIIVTGREDTPEIRQATLDWLDVNWFFPDKLIMRPNGDYCSAVDFKLRVYNEQILGKYFVTMVFEDNSDCVKMYRDLGLIVLQPNDGEL
jgi:predicted kinase